MRTDFTKSLYINYKKSIENMEVAGFSWDYSDFILELKHKYTESDMSLIMRFKDGMGKSRKAVKTQKVSDLDYVTSKKVKDILVNLENLVIIDMEWLDYMIKIKFKLIKPEDGITNVMLEFDHDILGQTEVGSYDKLMNEVMNKLNDEFLDEMLEKYSMEEIIKKPVEELKEMFGEFLERTHDLIKDMQEE